MGVHSRRWAVLLAAVAAVTGAPSPALAQERGDDDSSELRGEVSGSVVFASDRGDEEEADRSGFVLRGELDYERALGPGEIRLSYDTAVYLFHDDERPDRWTNRAALAYAVDVADDLEFAARLAYAENLGTLEFRSTDQVEALATATYSPGDHRVRLFGGWRWRDYDDEGDSEGSGPVFGAEYRYRLGRDNFLTAGLRFEDIDSASPRRGYDRVIAEAFYQHPLGEATRLRAGLSARWWEYDGRFAPNGERRRDSAIVPELDVAHDFRSGFLLRGRVQYGFRESNDPAQDADDRRAILTAGYRF